jgi:hypothetical protein
MTRDNGTCVVHVFQTNPYVKPILSPTNVIPKFPADGSVQSESSTLGTWNLQK